MTNLVIQIMSKKDEMNENGNQNRKKSVNNKLNQHNKTN